MRGVRQGKKLNRERSGDRERGETVRGVRQGKKLNREVSGDRERS